MQKTKSPIEISFWEHAKPLIPELQDEVWIDKYRVDFLIPSKKVIIELYGYAYHNEKKKITKDAERERYLQRLGYQVIRFTGSEIYKDVKKCVTEVLFLAKIEPAKIAIIKNEASLIKTKSTQTTKNNKKPKLNKKQATLINILSIIALCLACSAINTTLNWIAGK